MLRSLYIKNYALIEEIKVDFSGGLSIITGETGAGKSILIDAISLLVGERASGEMIRRGGLKAIIEAEFDISPLSNIQDYLKSNGIECETNDLLIRREINQKGTSRAFINDSPASIAIIKELGTELLDLHGQHEHQSLLHPELHLDFLDDYACLNEERKHFQLLYEKFNVLKKTYHDIVGNKERMMREREFLVFQLHEIQSVNPLSGEDGEIERELSILENSEELRNLTGELYDLLYQSDNSVHLYLAKAKSSLERLKKIDPHFNEQLQELQSAIATVDELAHWLSSYQNGIEFLPERLEALRNRQIAISRLKKKYGPALNDVLALAEKLTEQIGPEQNADEKLQSLKNEMMMLQTQASAKANALSEARKKAARTFEKKIIGELGELGIEHAKFRIDIMRSESTAHDLEMIALNGKNFSTTKNGIDKVEFFISTNKGEDPKPLAKVASGGEISRIMLALKTVLSAGGKIPLMIFDEIDSGISGRIAQQVGKAMKNLSSKHQIIAITHLGQIAAFADTHYIVEKSTVGNITTSAIRKLSSEEHEEEIARLISGSKITDRSLEAARSLLQEASTLVEA